MPSLISRAFALRPLLCLATMALPFSVSSADDIEFNRDIRPILTENCFACHGPDQNKVQGGLRLDDRPKAMAPSDSGKIAIVPGKSLDSEMMKRILSEDPDIHMPPASTEKRLSENQKALLAKWIDQGAPYQGHWAFQPPLRRKFPKETASLRHPIDRWTEARLRRESLQPNEEADRSTLIRRASLDLTGLPPTPEELDRFLKDSSPNAYEKMLDRLFASTRYGERMALTWMDYARYADSNGYQSDGSRDIWAWRNWVIDAYNANMPFDQFTIEQLAGDMLPNPSESQIIATGFNRNHRLNGEGGRIEAEWFVETVIDRVETTGLTWLGLTFNCCRCHDHKYDPITQKEFYSLFAFFNSCEESGVLAPVGKNGENTPPLLTVSTPDQNAQLEKMIEEQKILEAKLVEAEVKIPEWLAQWEKSQTDRESAIKPDWSTLAIANAVSKGGANLEKQEDGSYLATGKNPDRDVYEIEAALETDTLTAILLEVFPDDRLPGKSLGRASNGNFVLTSVEATLEAPSLDKPMKVVLNKAMADYEQSGWTAQSVLTPPNKRKKEASGNFGWAIDGNDPNKKLARRIAFLPAKPISVPKGARLRWTMKHESQYASHNVGRFRLGVTNVPQDAIQLEGRSLQAEIQSILRRPVAERSTEQVAQLTTYFKKNVDSPYREAAKTLEEARAKEKSFRENLPTTMVMKEGKTRDAFVLVRGQYDQPSEKVGRAVPAFLPPFPSDQPLNRLGLARWIVSENNPLTARVWVNREWERFFGTGLVKTTENLGTQSEFPVNLELLDWLALEFMRPTPSPDAPTSETGRWDMKRLQKTIMMSQAYRRSSRVDDASYRIDPENRLLARGPRIRLQGEVLRDSALFVSGLLIDKLGGPSVRPYMPEGVWDETSKYGNLRNYKHDREEGLYRRTLYTIWKRTAAPPSMLLFDAPNRETCTIKRSRTNTPLQALSLLNEVTYVEAAKHFAARMLREGGKTLDDRIDFGFRLALSRTPTPREKEVLRRGVESDRERFREKPESAHALLKVGEKGVTDVPDASELAAYTLLANVLLNLDEFITRE